jgi:group I intron endonuclease
MTNQPGIYRIVNTVSGRTYLGSSVRVQSRLSIHKRNLQLGVHVNCHLQASWVKHGADAFTFEYLTSCDPANLMAREQQFIDAYLEHGMPLYNQKPSAGTHRHLHFQHSPEAKMKMSKAKKGQSHGPRPLAVRMRISLTKKGVPRPPTSPEVQAKMTAALKGRIFSAEHRNNLSRALKGKPLSAEHREKIRQIQTGRTNGPHAAETREKIRAALKGRPLSQKNRDGLKRAWITRRARMMAHVG